MRTCGLSLLLFPLITVAGIAADDSKEAEAIGKLNVAYVEAFNLQQPQKVADQFTADGDYLILTGDMLMKRDAIAKGHASFFGNNPKAKIMGKQLSIRFVRPDVAVSHGQWNVSGGPADFPSQGLWDAVVVKDNGNWRYESVRLSVPVRPATK